MLDRFIYFKEEINIVLSKASLLNNIKKKDLNLETFSLKYKD